MWVVVDENAAIYEKTRYLETGTWGGGVRAVRGEGLGAAACGAVLPAGVGAGRDGAWRRSDLRKGCGGGVFEADGLSRWAA